MMFWKNAKLIAVACVALALGLAGAAILTPENLPQASAGWGKIPKKLKARFDQIAAEYMEAGDKLSIHYKHVPWSGSQEVHYIINKKDGSNIYILGQQKPWRYEKNMWRVRVFKYHPWSLIEDTWIKID